jgi:Arc/MetJ family transcription regulator
MRTNIVIDDKLMNAVMSSGEYKTKREAVEAGLRLIQRRKTYDGLIALRGKLQWDDSDAGWAKYRAEQIAKAQAQAAGLPYEGELDPSFRLPTPAVHEATAGYGVKTGDAT